MKASKNIINRIYNKLKRTVGAYEAKLRVNFATRHVLGPRRISLAENEVVLICMLKNGSYYIDSLIKHHRMIGIENFLFIDNGSSDDTIEKLSTYENVTVVSNSLPVAKFESLLRSEIAKRIVDGGWFLFVDSDELFEMINGEDLSIKEYTNYCNLRNYEVIVGQALDLFSPLSLSETCNWSYEKSISEFNRYSLNEINNYDYHDDDVAFSRFLRHNSVSNRDIKIKFGGIRKELFGENCALTVHRMVRNLPHTRPYTHPHCSSDTKCADFTMLLRHYKFVGPYFLKERQQALEQTWTHGENLSRLNIITDQSFAFEGKKVEKFTDTQKLVDQGFLTCSEEFLKNFPSRGS